MYFCLQLFILVGVYLVLSALAVLIIILFVPNLNARDDPRQKGETQKAKLSLKHCAKTLKQLTNKLQLLMVPLNVYIGLEEGFTMVEYTVVRISFLEYSIISPQFRKENIVLKILLN